MAIRLRHQILVRDSYFILIKFDSDNTDISVRTPRSRRSNIIFCEFRAFLIGVGRTQKKKGKERKEETYFLAFVIIVHKEKICLTVKYKKS